MFLNLYGMEAGVYFMKEWVNMFAKTAIFNRSLSSWNFARTFNNAKILICAQCKRGPQSVIKCAQHDSNQTKNKMSSKRKVLRNNQAVPFRFDTCSAQVFDFF